MLDIFGTMKPSAGVARSCTLMAPDDSPLWIACVDVGLSTASLSAGRKVPEFVAVGAYGWTRTDALLRAAGEAVERFCLIAPLPDPVVADFGCSAENVHLVNASLLAPGAETLMTELVRVLEPFAGENPSAAAEIEGIPGEICSIPAGLVTDPIPASRWIDSSPSSAAAGPSWNFAVGRALLESVERDAIQCCWALRPRLPFHDSIKLADRFDAIVPGALEDVQEYISRHELRCRTVLVPSGVLDVTVGITFLDGYHAGAPLLAMGARAGSSMRDCVASSLREAMQGHISLCFQSDTQEHTNRAGPILDETTRAWYCLSSPAREHYIGWLERASYSDLPQAPPMKAEPSTAELLKALREQGLRPLVATLTCRLPEQIQSLGWNAVRVLVLGHQPYRMDETREWTWALPRLQDWRTRFPGTDDVDVYNCPPHPLI